MKTTTEITNSLDVIDSRDIEERIKELETELLQGEERYTGETEDLKDELTKLQTFKEEADTAEWDFGVIFIQESYFEDYARELASDLGAIQDDMKWPCNYIDWKSAANELLIDYSQAEFDGVTYYFR